MTKICVTVDQRDFDPGQIQRILVQRFQGRPFRYGALAFLLALYFATFLLLVTAFGETFFPNGGLTYLLPAFAAILALGACNDYAGRRLRSALSAAPFRQDKKEVRLAAVGNHSNGFICWAHVPEVIELNDLTLLLLSPVECFPIPHAALPANLTPDVPAAQIATWRAQ